MDKLEISPSLLSGNFAHMGQEISDMTHAGADLFHVDVMDGHFVPNLTMGPDMVRSIRPLTKLPLDVHLMVMHPQKFIEPFARAGADMISCHVEAKDNPAETLALIRSHGKKAGIVLNPDTAPEAIFPYLLQADYVLIMTVFPGFSGAQFQESGIEAIQRISQELKRLGHDIPIEVDGGITDQTIHKAASAGAKIFVSGSYLFRGGKDAYAQNIEKLRRAAWSG